MALSAPQALDADHGLEGFDCGKPSLNEWLLRHARQAQASGSAKTYVVSDGGRVAGYYSLTVGQIDTLETPDRARRGMGAYPIPVVILARMAVAREYQGRGIGVGMLQDAIRRTLMVAEQAGVRALLTHPIDDEAARFYKRFGFEASPVREQQLLLLLKDALILLVDSQAAGADEDTKKNQAESRLEEVIVTAQHREQRLQDVPMAMSALGRELLENNEINNIEDLSKLVPSVTLTPDGTPGGGDIRIRCMAPFCLTARSLTSSLPSVFPGRARMRAAPSMKTAMACAMYRMSPAVC